MSATPLALVSLAPGVSQLPGPYAAPLASLSFAPGASERDTAGIGEFSPRRESARCSASISELAPNAAPLASVS